MLYEPNELPEFAAPPGFCSDSDEDDYDQLELLQRIHKELISGENYGLEILMNKIVS